MIRIAFSNALLAYDCQNLSWFCSVALKKIHINSYMKIIAMKILWKDGSTPRSIPRSAVQIRLPLTDLSWDLVTLTVFNLDLSFFSALRVGSILRYATNHFIVMNYFNRCQEGTHHHLNVKPAPVASFLSLLPKINMWKLHLKSIGMTFFFLVMLIDLSFSNLKWFTDF